MSSAACPKCKQPIPPKATTCPHCGTALQAQEEANDFLAEEIQHGLPDVLKQLETAANINLTVASGLIAFYSGGLFAGRISAPWTSAILYALPIALFLLVIISALQVFYPKGYLQARSYRTLIEEKNKRLQRSSLLLQVAIAVLILSVFVYLIRPA